MKYFKSLLVTSLIVSTSAAADVKNITVNCDDVKLHINTVMDDRFNFSAYWNEPARFPEPPKYIEVGDTIRSDVKTFKFSCPDFKVYYDGNMAEIVSNDYQNVLRHISEHDYKVDLYFHGWYQYPAIRKGFNSVDYGFNLKDFSLYTSIYDLPEGVNLAENFRYYSVPKTAVIGYVVDNNPLKPLLHGKKVSNYKSDLNNANTIDIYHKNNDEQFFVKEGIQRIHIDKANGILRIYRNAKFPSN